MSACSGLPRGLSVLLTSVLLLTISNTALASSRTCEFLLDPIHAVTLKSLREKNTASLQKEIAQHPMPGFDYIENEVKNEQIGLIGPRALQQMLGPDTSFIRTPAPSAAMDTAVNLHEEGRSFPVHVDNHWHGARTSTAVYASMPKTYVPKASHYLVGREYPVVIIHLHGGGTPTATGKNAMSIGQALAGANVPVLALDLPGHGRATRQIDGFTTFKDQIDWIMKIMDKLVDPNVKIIVSGHSWGGQFTAYWRRLTRDPKYRWRIARFITVSPPVDVSLGGDEKVSDEFEEWFEHNFRKFKKESSKADFEFQSNSVRNGKTSTAGGIFTGFTFMDYKMTPLTDADRRELVREDAFTGESDIITWLGRQEQGLKQWGGDITVLPEGMTWKGKQKTGHNVWDLMIEGTKKLFMYDYFTRAAQEVAGPEGMGGDVESDQATKLMDQFFRNYANFFLFRQMIANHDEYVSAMNLTEQQRKDFGTRKTMLENLVRANGDREAYAKKEADRRAVAAIEALRKELGITEAISLDRAKEELALPPMTDARRAELEAYLATVDKLDADIKDNGFQDVAWDKDQAELKSKYAKILAKFGVTDLTQCKPALDALMAKGKSLPKAEEDDRKQLSSLHQTYVQKFREHQGRFGKARDAQLAQLSRPAGISDYKAAQRELKADRSEARRHALEQYVARIAGVEAAARAEVAQQSDNIIGFFAKGAVDAAAQMRADIDAMEAFTYCPAGDEEICSLAAEVKALTEERTRLLKGQIEPTVTLIEGELQMLTGERKQALLEDVNNLTAMRVSLVDSLQSRKEAKDRTIEALERELKDLTVERSQLAKQWEKVWHRKDVDDDDEEEAAQKQPEEIVTSPAVAAYEAELTAKEVLYRELYLSFEDSSRKWLRQLKNAGQLTAANVVAMTPELIEKRKKYYDAKADYEAFRAQGDSLRWNEALAGHLQGPDKGVKTALNAAAKIWGKSITEPSNDSLVSRIRTLEEKVERIRSQESVLTQRISRAQWQYSQAMTEKGVKLPFVVQRVAIREALDMPYNDLVARLREDTTLASAFRLTLDKWTSYLAVLRSESQTKDAGNY